MSGYGPPRGWRGSNAWGTASPQRTEETMSDRPADPQHDAAMHGVAEKWLADMRNDYNAYRRSHAHEGAFACCSAHAVADRVPTLVAALDAMRGTLAAYVERESADAAAGSYAGRAEEAEAERSLAQKQVGELLTELADARRQAQQQHAVGLILAADKFVLEQKLRSRDIATERAEKAEAVLAELRERLGKPVVQWAVMLDDTESSPLPEKVARRMASDPFRTTLLTRDTYPDTAWRPADATPRTALERAADEQGVPLVCDVDKLTAPEHERLSDEEWTAYAGALGIETGDEQGSTRDQIERFLTDDGRRKVAEYLAEAAGDDDIDIDAVIAQNHADAHREYFGVEQGDGEGGGV